MLILETNKWIINKTTLNSTPTHIVLGTVRELWPSFEYNPTTCCLRLVSENKEVEVHRALDYYFNRSNPISELISSNENGVIVHSVPDSSSEFLALTYASNKDITVYNSAYTHNIIIGTTLHEIGHIRHYGKIGSYSTYYTQNLVEKRIKESYASFIGWLLGEDYYLSKGFVKPDLHYHINSNHRQTWYWGGANTDYSPLFIDLVDNFNQGASDSRLPYDEIDLVPINIVDNIVNSEYTVSDVFNVLSNYIDYYFSSDALHEYENAYEY